MKGVFNKVKYVVLATFMVGVLASCTSHPDEDQIKVLEETKAAALSAEQTLADKKKELKDLQAKLQAKKAELAKVKAEKENVMSKIAAQNTEN
jgi:septal ring factor EnvC (AmiA/AmiB activator)